MVTIPARVLEAFLVIGLIGLLVTIHDIFDRLDFSDGDQDQGDGDDYF